MSLLLLGPLLHYDLGVSLACLRGYGELRSTFREYTLPRRVLGLNVWFESGNVDSESTYSRNLRNIPATRK